METESEFDQLELSTSLHPSPHSPKLKRLKKSNPLVLPKSNVQQVLEPKELDGLDPLLSESDKMFHEPEELDGLDPLFSEGVKRVLEFNGPEFDDSDWDKEMEDLDLPKKVDFAEWKSKKKRKNVQKLTKSEAAEFADGLFSLELETLDKPGKLDFAKVKNKKKRKNVGVDKPKVSKNKEKEERKAYLAQQADFQRIMRERKSVGFKPVTMVEKPISSVLEKIRQRKMEVSKKMGSRTVHKTAKEIMLDNHVEDEELVVKDVLDAGEFDGPVNKTSEDKSCSSDGEARTSNILVDEIENSFRPPVDDTQDLFSDSQSSNPQELLSNEERGSPVEDVSPSLPSLNLMLDSSLPSDISSDEEESDKENTNPLSKHMRKDNFSHNGDHSRQFLDEEALEEGSDDELLDLEDKDEEDDDDIEELIDFIDTDYKEKPIDLERRNQLHQTLMQQADELKLKKPKYGANQKDDDESDDNDDDNDDDDVGLQAKVDKSDSKDTGNPHQTPSTREITDKLKAMIPLMFTDEDDGFVSSDEEPVRILPKEHSLRKEELERKTKLMSAAKDASSRDVLGRIRKLNSAPETKKKAKTPSIFDTLLSKESSSNLNKSLFLRRASSHPVPSSHRQGPSTGRSFIFGRDDSRSSAPIIEDSPASNQTESQVKKVVSSAKFSGSQVKLCTQETQQVAGTSLFDILKRSSIQIGHDSRENMVDHQAVFASLRSVKKKIKVDGRL